MYQSISQSNPVGQHYIYLPEADSTNTWCRSRLSGNHVLPEGILVQAGHQTAGRGQMGNVWQAAPGENLTFSCVLYPEFLAPGQQFLLTMVASLSIAYLLDSTIEGVFIKWPNDVYTGRYKIAGILIENGWMSNKIQHSIVGIGININQRNFKGIKATSLLLETGQYFPLEKILERWCGFFNELYNALKRGETEVITAQYYQRLWGYQKVVEYTKNGYTHQGVLRGVNELGQLIMDEDGTGRQLFNFKEISFVI